MANEESVIAEDKRPKSKPKGTGRRGTFGTIREISDSENVPYSTVRQLLIEGRIPFTVFGDSTVRRVRWSDWDRFVESSTERAEQR